MRVFFDTEFTGLHQKTTLISIGLIADTGETFYAELTDYDPAQVDDWLKENVISHLTINDYDTDRDYHPYERDVCYKGDKESVARVLDHWLDWLRTSYPADNRPLEMWSDVLAYDWVLFCELFGGALNIPENVHYIPRDLATFLEDNRINPDINREEFAALPPSGTNGPKHNALWDAKVIRACYQRIAGWKE